MPARSRTAAWRAPRSQYRFFDPTAHWLEARWPDRLRLVWREFEQAKRVENLLPLFVAFAESPALDELEHATRGWLDRLARPGRDRRRVPDRGLPARVLERRGAREDLGRAGRAASCSSRDRGHRRAGASGSGARRGRSSSAPLDRSRPDLSSEAMRPPIAVRPLAIPRGRKAVDLARGLHGDPQPRPRRVRLRRTARRAARGLRRRARVRVHRRDPRATPAARVGLRASSRSGTGCRSATCWCGALFGSAEIAYNVFETWRGAEAGRIYGRVLGMVQAPVRRGQLHDRPLPARRRQRRGDRVRRVVVLPEAGFPGARSRR